jgi:hypothetical protein
VPYDRIIAPVGQLTALTYMPSKGNFMAVREAAARTRARASINMKKSHMNPEKDYPTIDLILPARIIAELQARATARGCEPSQLVMETFRAALSKDASYWHQSAQRAKSIDGALARGEPKDWPEEFEDCLVVSSLLGVLIEKTAEASLMEMGKEQMDIVELICREKGLSYEAFIREAIDAKLSNQSPEEDDPADSWKGDSK